MTRSIQCNHITFNGVHKYVTCVVILWTSHVENAFDRPLLWCGAIMQNYQSLANALRTVFFVLPSSTGNPVPQPRALLQSISQFCLSAGLEVVACTVKTQYFAVSLVSKTPQPGSMPLALDCGELRILISHASVDTFKYPPIGSRDERQLTLCTRQRARSTRGSRKTSGSASCAA